MSMDAHLAHRSDPSMEVTTMTRVLVVNHDLDVADIEADELR
jgi:hypothetical protein